jgi:endoglycosylceramidase
VRTLTAGVLVALLFVVGIVSLGMRPSDAATVLPSSSSPGPQPPAPLDPSAVQGPIRSPGGPYLYDQQGRVVFFHGVNAVYKLPPYELYPAPGKAWNFSPADASLIATLGFNVVRLGMTWSGLEPGTAAANNPSICRSGTPGDPHQFDQTVLDRYLQHLDQTIALLGQYHIYTLLDMHQDVYARQFDGEGAPNWAVCTHGAHTADVPGRWSQNYTTPAANAAFHHFWTNSVAGNLQGEYDRVWAAVAAHFRTNPWVLGYDPYNEPFSRSLVTHGDEQFATQLQCFYTGTAVVKRVAHPDPPLACRAHDPAIGVIPRILAADPTHLIFYEPDIFGSRGRPSFVGPMSLPNLVFNVHVYCSYRSGLTGNPTDTAACASQGMRTLTKRSASRSELTSLSQPNGPAWFVSGFGATSNVTLLGRLTGQADRTLVGWTYWSWKYYGDPTGSADEALVSPDGGLRCTARVLTRTYPQAVAGKPTSLWFDPTTGGFRLTYTPDHAVHAATVISVPTRIHYPSGYCARVSGGSIISGLDSQFLEVANAPTGRSVVVSVMAGHCAVTARTAPARRRSRSGHQR